VVLLLGWASTTPLGASQHGTGRCSVGPFRPIAKTYWDALQEKLDASSILPLPL
jgi:hypothetical protein